LRLCGYGRFAAQKGFDDLIEAMRLVPPEVATLRLVGLGPNEAALRAQAAGLPHVSVEGPVSGPEALLGQVDAVALPSRFEAYGIVAAEARAAARPAILADVDGLTGHALAGYPQLLVPSGDIARLAESIVWLAGQDVTSLGLACRASAAKLEEECVGGWASLLLYIASA
jgi:glycosyltransferase involved in cell wall biosynthesis